MRFPQQLRALRAPFQRVIAPTQKSSDVFSLDKAVYQPPSAGLGLSLSADSWEAARSGDLPLALGVAGVAGGALLASLAGRRALAQAGGLLRDLRTRLRLRLPTVSLQPRRESVPGSSREGSILEEAGAGAGAASRRISSPAPAYVPLRVRAAAARLRHFLSARAAALSRALLGPGAAVDLSVWHCGALRAATELPGGYVRYSFALDSARSYLPLDVGQEVGGGGMASLCASAALCVIKCSI
jgi:hypothetical protein